MALFPTYNRFPVAVERANGTVLEDNEGKTYLDFGSGIGVTNLGHRHPVVEAAVTEQLKKYWHVSNLYQLPIQEEVAAHLAAHSCGDNVFFCNSGAEANEAAIKLARKVTGKEKVITFQQSFHGRTFATMAATGQEKVRIGYGPMLPSFSYATFNDLDSVATLIDGETAAVMVEVVQGEGGVILGDEDFLTGLETLCAKEGILFIIDEIQTGIGRTGKKFAYEHYGLKPDIITLAKGLGNGLPVGAMIAKAAYRDDFGAGAHGSTFGGNPVAMAAAKAVIETVFAEDFLLEIEAKAAFLKELLEKEITPLSKVKEIRQKGMMIGIVCEEMVGPYVMELIGKGLLVLNAGEHVLRLLPPLTVTTEEMEKAIQCIKETLS